MQQRSPFAICPRPLWPGGRCELLSPLLVLLLLPLRLIQDPGCNRQQRRLDLMALLHANGGTRHCSAQRLGY